MEFRSPNNEFAVLAGDLILRYIVKDTWEIKIKEKISHGKDITLLEFINENTLVTCGVDNYVKIWNFDDSELLFMYHHHCSIYNIQVDNNVFH